MRSARPRSALSQKMRRARHFLKNMRRARHFRKKERGEGARSALLQLKLNAQGSKSKISSDPASPSPQRRGTEIRPWDTEKSQTTLTLFKQKKERKNKHPSGYALRPPALGTFSKKCAALGTFSKTGAALGTFAIEVECTRK